MATFIRARVAGRRVCCLVVAALLVLLGSGSWAQEAAPLRPIASALLAIDQSRATVVDRVVRDWGDALAAANVGLDREQLRAMLTGLRSDHLLAASLAGSLEGLRNSLSTALTATAEAKPSLLQAKALGDTADDLVYTPVVPCRLADTRLAGGAITANTTRNFKVWVSSGGFTAQGGDAGNCNVPADPPAVVLNFAAVNPGGTGNLIAYPTGGALPNTSVLNYQSGTFALSNGAIIPACVPNCANQLSVKANGPTVDVVIDIVGYFKRPGNYGGTHVITGLYATDSGGFNNTASGDYSTVAGGSSNTASGSYSNIGGGLDNTASGESTIGGGQGNLASGYISTIAGGGGNVASSIYSTVAGGEYNTASGNASTVAGGGLNTASGSFSFAAGYRAKALANGSVVFGDSTNADITSNVSNQFVVAASGGIIMVTNKNTSTGCFMVAGGGTWNCTSDRNVKRDFTPIAAQSILRKVVGLPLSMWRYEAEAGGVRHIGPSAQDFHQAFGLGQDERTIALVDADGVALAAIQGLHQQLVQKSREIALLKRRLETIEARLGSK